MYSKVTGASDLDWSEIAELFDSGLHPDHLRKMGAGIKLASDAGMLRLYPDMSELEKDNPQRLRDLRNEINEARRAQSRSEALREEVVQAARNMPTIQVVPGRTVNVDSHRSLVVCIADCHYGAKWTIRGLKEEVINAYNPAIFEARMADLLTQTRLILEKEKIERIVLLLCGDALDGMLRANQLMRLRWGVVESCMRFSEYMARWIGALAADADIEVYGVDGNHSEIRPLGSRRGEFENENLEKIILWHMAERLRSVQSVRVDEQAGKRKLVRVQGYTILLSHDTDTRIMEEAAKQAM